MTNKEKFIELYKENNNAAFVATQVDIGVRKAQRWAKAWKESQIIEIKKPIEQSKPVEQVMSIQKPQLNLDLQNGIVVVFSDAHVIPNRESLAAKALLKVLKLVNPAIVINGGDIFDFASISKHDKLGWADQYTVKDELEAGLELLNNVSKITPGARHIAIEGNHCTRFNKFLSKHIPQFKGIPGLNLTDHLPKEWQYAMSIMINNNTIFLHAYHGGVHCAHNNVIKSGLSIVTGHVHTLDIKPFTDYRGTRYGISTGTLATIQDNPLFAYTNGTPLNWQAGFVVLTYINGQLQYPETCSINYENKAFFRGQII